MEGVAPKVRLACGEFGGVCSFINHLLEGDFEDAILNRPSLNSRDHVLSDQSTRSDHPPSVNPGPERTDVLLNNAKQGHQFTYPPGQDNRTPLTGLLKRYVLPI